jgi:steroid delta-isomerase-like uncharacterized protein
MSVADDNRQRLVSLWNDVETEAGLDAMDGYLADDYVRHSAEGDHTREQFKEQLRGFHAAFGAVAFTIEDLVADGDRVAYRWLWSGTHEGRYMGVPATHRGVVMSGITISRFQNGRIAEDWASWNQVSVLHSLGIVPIDVR